MKLFFKIFGILLLSEIVLGIAGVFLAQGILPDFINHIGSIIIMLLSLPLSLIDRTYPFYATGPRYFGFSLLLLNILIHTIIVYMILNQRKANKMR